MKFEWDETKNKSNHKKHGIWFEDAMKVFADPEVRSFYDDSHSANEERFLALGYSELNRLLIVIHSYRGTNIIRLISARKATKKERAFYEERI